jgi:hypothetical protein
LRREGQRQVIGQRRNFADLDFDFLAAALFSVIGLNPKLGDGGPRLISTTFISAPKEVRVPSMICTLAVKSSSSALRAGVQHLRSWAVPRVGRRR